MTKTFDKKEFDDEVKRVVPSVFNVISSSSNNQESEETYNVNKFGLPDPAGKTGGACTTAFLKTQYDEKGATASWTETLEQMASLLKTMKFDQTPTFTSSRKIKASVPKQIVPENSGKRRALLIGINYVGQNGELKSPHNDCLNLKRFLIEKHSFVESEMMVFMDDGVHQPPTKENIENAFILLTKYSQPGDVNFVSFSGHGGRTKDLDGDEEDGWDSTLIPVDFEEQGMIVDDDILKMLVKPMKAGVTTTVLVDCCRSGSVLDLPYTFAAGDKKMTREKNFNMEIITKAVRPLTAAEKREQYYADKQKRKEERAARRAERAAERAKEAAIQQQSQEEALKLQEEAKKKLQNSVGPGVIVIDGSMSAQDIEKYKAKLESEAREKLLASGQTNVTVTTTTSFAFVH